MTVNFRRKLPDADWLEAIADLLVNLSAGWFGAIVIVPNFIGLEFPFSLMVLTQNIGNGIVSLAIAVSLKKWSKGRKNAKRMGH